MESYPYSYPDSHDSSPRSRENESWDEQPSSNYKVKFMCSYGGKILPRPHDNQLTYVGGETKILAVDRNIRFPNIISKLSSFSDNDVCFKYQLPGEDLDALISVTNDEDLEHMMLEYDRLYRSAGSRPARLRLFLFLLNSSNQSSFSADDPKSNQQWFVDALNSVPVPIQSLDSSSPPAPASDPDFLFGFEKQQQQVSSPVAPVAKLTELPIPEAKIVIGSDPVRDDRVIGSDSMFEYQRQVQELQRLQIANQEKQQALFQRKNEGNFNLPAGRAFQGDYYIPEKPATTVLSVPIPAPATMSAAPTVYWPDRHTQAGGGYPDQVTATERQQQMYLVPSPAGMYQTPATNVRQVPGPVGQGYYGMQRVVPDVYREQPVYSMGMGPPPIQPQIPQPQPQPQIPQMTGGYTTQVAYGTGRQVYYTTAAQGAVGVQPTYPTAVTTVSVDPRQSGALNPESKESFLVMTDVTSRSCWLIAGGGILR